MYPTFLRNVPINVEKNKSIWVLLLATRIPGFDVNSSKSSPRRVINQNVLLYARCVRVSSGTRTSRLGEQKAVKNKESRPALAALASSSGADDGDGREYETLLNNASITHLNCFGLNALHVYRGFAISTAAQARD